MLWEETYRLALEEAGFVARKANPCIFWHKCRNIQVAVHGNDFSALGTDDQLDWNSDQLSKNFEI